MFRKVHCTQTKGILSLFSDYDKITLNCEAKAFISLVSSAAIIRLGLCSGCGHCHSDLSSGHC